MSVATPRDPNWSAFPNTALEVYRDGLHRFDLTIAPDDDRRRQLQELGLGTHFAIVTACNPSGLALTDKANHERCEQLETEIAGGSAHFLRADGCSLDGTHRERGVAIALPLTEACALARRYGQSAIFWYDGDRFWIVPAAHHDPEERLPLPVTPPA